MEFPQTRQYVERVDPQASPFPEQQPSRYPDSSGDLNPYEAPVYPQVPLQEQMIGQVGAITVTTTTVRTPTGDIPLKGSTWRVADSTHIEQKVPAWAIVCAILFAVCTLGLSFLFLLARERQYTGAVEVSVSNEGRHYTARVPISQAATIQAIYNQVNYFQSIAQQM